MDFVLDNLDAVDESLRGVYEQGEDKKYRLNVDKYAEHKATGLRTKNQELLNKLNDAKGAKERAAKFEGWTDEDVDAFQEWKAQQSGDPADPKEPKTKDGDKVTKTYHDRKLAAEQQARTKAEQEKADLEKQVKGFKVWTPVKDACVKAGIIADRAETVFKTLMIDNRCDLDESGDFVFRDAQGKDTILTLAESIQQIKKEFPWAFAADHKGGSGSNNNHRADPKPDTSQLSPTEKLKAARRERAV